MNKTTPAEAAQEKLPVTKIARASKFLQTGLKVGRNYLNYGVQKVLQQHPDKGELDTANATDILKGMTQLRGTALKMAQMLSLDTVNLSTEFTTVLQKAQYSVPPMSAPLAVQAFTKSIGKAPDQVFDRFNPQAIKAASMGQVHAAEKNGQKLAVKIQYPGVADSIKSDLKIVKQFAPRFINSPMEEIEPYFEEVESKLLEEADYVLELKNSLAFKAACGSLEGVIFPEYYPAMSGDRVLTMSFLEGMHLKDFLATQPDKEIVTLAAQHIWDLYDYMVHELKRVNADPHPGNFLFYPDGTVGVLDFGCTKEITDEMYVDYFSLANLEMYKDAVAVDKALRKLNILRPDDTPDKVAYLTPLFTELIQLLSAPLNAGEFNFNNDAFYAKAAELGIKISSLREVRGSKEFLFINRTFFGLFTLLQRLDVTVRTGSRYLKLY